MINIDLAGFLIKMDASGMKQDDMIAKAKEKGIDDGTLNETMAAVEKDEVFEVHTLPFLTPVNPITYTIGMRKLSIQRKILWGLMKNYQEVGLSTIDTVETEETLISASVIIVLTEKIRVRIDKISRTDAKMIESFYANVIEAQRMKVVNISED